MPRSPKDGIPKFEDTGRMGTDGASALFGMSDTTGTTKMGAAGMDTFVKISKKKSG
jgi:hypothetical protein